MWDKWGGPRDILKGVPATSLSLCRTLRWAVPGGLCFPWSWSRPINFHGLALLPFLLLLLLFLLCPHGFWEGLHTEVPAEGHTEGCDLCLAGAAKTQPLGQIPWLPASEHSPLQEPMKVLFHLQLLVPEWAWEAQQPVL